jgi:hypothetical protein
VTPARCRKTRTEVRRSKEEKGQENSMGQINVNPPGVPEKDDTQSAGRAASNNLTWAIGAVVIIAALAIAIVYVVHNVHP